MPSVINSFLVCTIYSRGMGKKSPCESVLPKNATQITFAKERTLDCSSFDYLSSRLFHYIFMYLLFLASCEVIKRNKKGSNSGKYKLTINSFDFWVSLKTRANIKHPAKTIDILILVIL